MRDATLILMTLNELPGLRAMWKHIPRADLRECLVVDGGSTDGTQEFLMSEGVPVLAQTLPGWGEAARVGARQAATSQLVFFSPDGNQDPDDIPLLLDLLDEGNDLAIASRFAAGSVHADDGEILRIRARGCKTFTHVANRLFHWQPPLSDATNGFRAITRPAMARLDLNASGFELAYQMTLQAMKEGLRIAELPTFEGLRLAGRSKFSTIPVGLDHLKVLTYEWSQDPSKRRRR